VKELIKKNALFLGMLLGIGFLMTVSLVLSAALASLRKFFGGFLPAPEFILHGIDFILSAGIIAVLFAATFIWKIRRRVIVRGGRIDIGAAALDLLFRTDFLFRSGIHEILCGPVRVAAESKTRGAARCSGCEKFSCYKLQRVIFQCARQSLGKENG
jgi:hypothetical protein